jgi:hypothetical protein
LPTILLGCFMASSVRLNFMNEMCHVHYGRISSEHVCV